MRTTPALLILLASAMSCAGCASWSQKPVAQASATPAVNQVAVAPPPAPAPTADATPRFECSDGTISVSQTGCLINMAHARLPPGEASDRTPEAAH
jgi:hypothetical protein